MTEKNESIEALFGELSDVLGRLVAHPEIADSLAEEIAGWLPAIADRITHPQTRAKLRADYLRAHAAAVLTTAQAAARRGEFSLRD